MQRFQGVNGEVLPSTDVPNWLLIEHLLQRYRDVWVPIDTYPFLVVDVERMEARCAEVKEFAVFANGRMMQNMHREEAGGRLISALMGGGVNAGMSPNGNVIVEGIANPRANWMMYFNDPFYVGMHPFAALGTHYIYIGGVLNCQRTFGELVNFDGYSRPRSTHVDFDPLADLVRSYYKEFINGPREGSHDVGRLAELLDAIFIENEKILAAAMQHHRVQTPLETPFDYVAPTLTRYGRLTHDTAGLPRIEISFSLLHYEKALREFASIKSATQVRNPEAAFLHGVYCVVAIAACIEATANKLVFQQTGMHPDYRDKRQPLKKINDAAAALAARAGLPFAPLVPGQPAYDSLDEVRKLRNAFMHAKERDEEIDPATQTSVVFTAVNEDHCREHLKQLRLGIAQVYQQLTTFAPPIVTRDKVKWLDDLEVP